MNRLERAIKRALNKRKNKTLKESVKNRGIPLRQVDVTILPDNFKFDGVKVVNGTFCKTVGAYKNALAKNNKDMGGWHG